MNKKRVGIIGATGTVGQRLLSLLENHPWFDVCAVAGSKNSAGKTLEEAVKGKEILPIPKKFLSFPVYDGEKDLKKIAEEVDFVFCSFALGKDKTAELEERYAKAELPVVSTSSAWRLFPDVPMILPEINPEHTGVIKFQKRRLKTERGFIAVKPNCSLQSYVPMLTPLIPLSLTAAAVCTYQAVSGAGKTLETMPEIFDNVIPRIDGEEEKSELEPMKLWGKLIRGKIVPAHAPLLSARCLRVPVSDGHTAAVFLRFARTPKRQDILSAWEDFSGEPQALSLPSAPKRFITYFSGDYRPQPKLDRDTEKGMGVCVGQLKEDKLFDFKFVGLSHNTVRGAAGGAILLAELLYKKGYI